MICFTFCLVEDLNKLDFRKTAYFTSGLWMKNNRKLSNYCQKISILLRKMKQVK